MRKSIAERVAARVKSPIEQRVATRYKAALEMPEPGSWTAKDLAAWHAQTPKPRSIYDKLPDATQPFGWSTPAPVAKGEIPMPWRVAYKDQAKALLKKLFPKYDDIYVDYGDGLFRGRVQLWIGLRDNRDAAAHATRMEDISEGLQKEGFKVRTEQHGGRVTVHLLDDLPKDVLKS